MIINTKDYESILKGMITKHGIIVQSTIVIEELSELQKSICKFKRGKLDIENMIEEIAHVLLTIQYLVLYFNISKEVENEYRKSMIELINLL